MKKLLMVALSIVYLLTLFGCNRTPAFDNGTDTSDSKSSATTLASPDSNTSFGDTTAATTSDTQKADGTPTSNTNTTTSSCTHAWGQWVEKTPSTCKNVGVKERICANCQKTESKEIAKSSHTESSWITDKVATVTKEGHQYTQCIYCKQIIQEKTIPTIAENHQHTIAEWVTIKAPTCTASGTQSAICSCGKTLETKEMAPTRHDYKQTVVHPSPSSSGYTLHTCDNCGDNYKDTYTEFDNTPTTSLTYKSNGDGTCAVTGISDSTVQYVLIPSKSPSGDTVISINGAAFKGSKSILYVDMPDTITAIKGSAFESCSNLKTVIFPKNVEATLQLSNNCFASSGIENIDLSEINMESVPRNAFYNCKSLKTVKLRGVKSIETFAFSECSELNSLIHSGELTTIGDRSFENCKKLTVLRSKDSQYNLDTVLQFSYHSFYGSGIRDIVFNKDLKATNDAFVGCKNLGTVDFSQVESKFASFNNSKIEKLIFPSSISTIPYFCFSNATIGALTLPDSVTEIASGAFSGATISKITFGAGLKKIESEAFKDATATYDFSKVTQSLTIGYEAFANNTFTSFHFPKSTISIGHAALKGCNNLKTLAIPFIGENASTTSYSTDCFAWLFGESIDCWEQNTVVPRSLKTVIVHNNNLQTRDFLGVMITDLVVGKDITYIGHDNFDSSSALARVFYEGTEQEWQSVNLCTSTNTKLLTASKYFYSESRPSTTGNFWHYDSNGNISIWQ
ncbi:MAG: leucine-rich repeat protein [Clostridia bacterium]|nr:leucine-rich repeat protein [Clostridia bacterium]